MSDQQQTGSSVVLDLEALFLSREFGRRPVRSVTIAPASVASEPAWLEQVFLSDAFGHPEVLAMAARYEEPVPVPAHAVSRRPALVLLQGGGEGAIAHGATPPHHRAIAAVSGVAAAALAVAGLTSGTGQEPGRPPVTEQAQGSLPSHGGTGTGGVFQPGPAVSAGPPGGRGSTVTPAASGSAGINATLTAFSAPVASGATQGANGAGAPPAVPAPPGGSAPGAPGSPPGGGVGGGGSGMLTPALTVVGNEISSVGTGVSSTSGEVGQALPVGSVLQAVGTVATSAMNNLGGGTPPTILAGGLQQ